MKGKIFSVVFVLLFVLLGCDDDDNSFPYPKILGKWNMVTSTVDIFELDDKSQKIDQFYDTNEDWTEYFIFKDDYSFYYYSQFKDEDDIIEVEGEFTIDNNSITLLVGEESNTYEYKFNSNGQLELYSEYTIEDYYYESYEVFEKE